MLSLGQEKHLTDLVMVPPAGPVPCYRSRGTDKPIIWRLHQRQAHGGLFLKARGQLQSLYEAYVWIWVHLHNGRTISPRIR